MKFSQPKVLSSASAWFPLFAGTLLTISIAMLLHFQNQEDDRAHIKWLAARAESLIKERFDLYEYGLRGARGAIVTAGTDEITRQQFENYIGTRDIPREFPGALGFGFIRRVPIEEEKQFLDIARQDGMPDFSIRTLNPHEDDRFIIQYIYPIAANKQAIGLDIGSEMNRRNAALASARENRAYLTEPITLVQADNKVRHGALVLLPIFRNDFTMGNPEARQQNVVGWSYAPLIIDDVLSGLPQVVDQAQIQLRNETESTPFFVSDDNGANYHSDGKEVRVIDVLGQKWNLELIPNDKAYLFHRWDMHWVIGIGMVLTFLLVQGANYLRTHADPDWNESSEAYQAGQRVLLFIRSSIVRKTWPTAIVTLLAILLLMSWLLLDKQKTELANQLTRSNYSIHSNLKEAAQQYSRDVLFLANTPPIKAMLDMDSVGINSMDRASKQKWLDRIAEIFKAYMLTSDEVFQVRLITEKSHWSEQVKVQREGTDLIVFDESSLQEKSSEPYILQTLSVGNNQVYLSDINLNREYGAIEIPHRPVWRFSTSLFFDDGTPFGLIIINLNATAIIDNITQRNQTDTNIQTYITNNEGQYLVHPEVHNSFAFESGSSKQWSAEFHPVESAVLAVSGVKEYTSSQGGIWAAESRFQLENSKSPRYLHIYTTSKKSPFFIQLSWQVMVVFIAILLLTTLSGGIQYWLWLSSLAAQREKWNQQLQRQQVKELTRFKALLESSPEATLIVDQSGVVKMVNAEAENVFGLSREQIENNTIDHLIPHEFRAAHSTHLTSYMTSPQNRRMAPSRQLFALKGSGEPFPVEISLSSVPMDDELLVSVSLRDITERLKFEQQLKDALRDAENATRAKSAFLANTSHEIRTPLNAIIGLTHLMTNEILTESQRLLVDKISLSGKSLLGIVNDVLDLSKIEAGEMSLELLPVELCNFVDEISSIFSIQAEQKALEFTLTLAPDLPRWIEADPVRLKQIIGNLLSNALKFTDSGKICLNVEQIATSDIDAKPKSMVRFSVVDTGIGISAKHISRLFKPFSQADASTTRRYGGTGLGLSIVSQLVGLMGGEVEVISKEAEGSTFSADIPFSVISADEIELSELQNQQMLYLMVAEDDEDDAERIISLTRSFGWRADLINDGYALVERFIARYEQGLRLPDALIVDWKMPILDGIAALEALAARVGEDKLPAVLMVSAFEKQQIEQMDHNHLIDTILQKPVNASAMFNAVNDAVCRLTGNIERVLNATSTDQLKVKWLANTRILVVDDSDTNLEVATYLLDQAGADVETASSGGVAINKLKDKSSSFDAVLMDVQMPVMDGLATTQYIRQSLNITNLPIIALTAGALVEERKRALEAGMDDFLTKPISPAQLIRVLRTHIAKQSGKTIKVEEINLPLEQDDDWLLIDGLDIAQAKGLLMNNKELFFNTLQHLLENNENLFIEDPDEISFENSALRQRLAAQAHKLRSSAGMIGATRLQTLATLAENSLRESDTKAENLVHELSFELKKLYTAAQDALLDWENHREMPIALSNTENVDIVDLVIQLQKMFNDQDLSALSLVEQEKEQLLNVLGQDKFDSLLNSTKRLNFAQAKALLAPFVLS